MSEEEKQQPKQKIGPYELGERVARDPSGRSFASTDPETERPVTIKLLQVELGGDEASLRLFEEGIESAAELKNPNVLEILDRGQDGDQEYLVMEELPGPTLHSVLKQRRPSMQEAFRVFRKVATGIEAAHEKGIVQGDLSPRAIAVSENLSVVKLTDIGIPRSSSLKPGGKTMTSTASGAGTLAYVAPERATGQEESDPRSDIYSLGVLFYQMLTGSVPFGKFNLPSRVRSEIPPEIDPVVLRCLEADPAERYSSVEALLRDVGRLEDKLQLGLMTELQGIGQSIRKPTTTLMRHARGVGLAVIAVLIVGVVGFGVWRSKSEPTKPEQGDPAGVPIEVTMADPLESRPSESLAVAIDATEVPAIESKDESEPPDEGSRAAAEAESDQPAARPEPARPQREAGREAYEVAAEKARNNLYSQAMSDLQTLLASGPSLSVEADALSLKAQVEEAQGRVEDAMGTYTEISTRFQGRKLQIWARYNFGRLALLSSMPNKMDVAIDVFEEVADTWPNSEYAADALASKATVETGLKTRVADPVTGKRVAAAFVTSRTLVERYPEDPAAEHAYWLLGQEYEELKEWQKAADAYWKLGTSFPQTRYEAWWEAGQLYDRRLDDKATAIQAYRQVAQGSEHYNDAQRRITRLSR